MGAFDDLIPGGKAPPPAKRGAFDDLIPKQEKPAGWLDLLESLPRGLVKGVTSGAYGGDPDVLAAQVGMGQSVDDILGTQKDIQRELPEGINKLPLHKPAGQWGKFGESIGESLGNPASYVGPGGVAGKVAYGALGGAGAEAGGMLTGDSLLGRIAGGVTATLAPRTLSRVISPTTVPAGRQADVDALRAKGVEPTAGDVTGSARVRGLEEMGNLPGGGRSYSGNQEVVARQYTRALNKRIGVDEELATPEVLERVEKDIQTRMEDAATRSRINQDQRLGDGLVAIVKEAAEDGMTKETVDRLTKLVTLINSKFDRIATTKKGTETPYMTGENYHSLTSDRAPLDRAMNDRDPNVAYYASRLRSELDDALERTANRPGTREGVGARAAEAELRDARRQWYTSIILRRSVADFKQAGVEGLIDPYKLRINLTKGADPVTTHAANKLREMGETELFDISRSGNAIVRPFHAPPDVERASGYSIPGVVSGVGGRVVNTGPAQRYLKNQVAAPLREALPPSGVAMPRAAAEADEGRQPKHKLPKGWKVEQLR